MAQRIVDACCLINLWASGKAASILSVYEGEYYLSEHVRNESLSIRQPGGDDGSKLVPVAIDLAEAVGAGLLHECRLEGAAEFANFVLLATQLDDGEASCLAIAQSRGWTVATDDRKALRMASELGIATITTPEILQAWVAATTPKPEEVADVLSNIERYARFRPHRSSRFYDWWFDRSEE